MFHWISANRREDRAAHSGFAACACGSVAHVPGLGPFFEPESTLAIMDSTFDVVDAQLPLGHCAPISPYRMHLLLDRAGLSTRTQLFVHLASEAVFPAGGGNVLVHVAHLQRTPVPKPIQAKRS